jgi:hypothetical protein
MQPDRACATWSIRAGVAALVLVGAACESRSPTGAGGSAAVPIRITAVTVGTPISTLIVDVTAPDLSTALVFNLEVVDGIASGTIRIPPGEARTIEVTAVDDQGEVTHDGSATIDVRPGQNPPVQIVLRPRSGHVPITVTFGNYTVLVTPAAATIDATATADLQLTATVIDVDGQDIPDPNVGWATTQPTIATVTASGLVTGVTNGTATIVATYEGVAGLSTITVTGIGSGTSCTGWSWTPTNVDPCGAGVPAPGATLTLAMTGSYEYDTNTGTLTAPDGSALTPSPVSALVSQSGGTLVRVLTVSGLDVASGTALRVTGSYPLVILAYGTATVSGTIDVSAAADVAGPGANASQSCTTGFGTVGTDATANSAAGGGGGGAYGTAAASGGNGGGGAAGGSGGSANGTTEITPLQGGCAGGFGGGPGGGVRGGAPGGGGGAIQIAVRDLLTVNGTVRSAGGGGVPDAASGGGGGGSGGGILLESDVVYIGSGAALCANGGSGAEGGDGTTGPGVGSDGTCSTTTGAITPAQLPAGGDGGPGAFASTLPGAGGNGTTGAGGGGGGSVGRVRVRGVSSRVIDPGAVVTPTAAP